MAIDQMAVESTLQAGSNRRTRLDLANHNYQADILITRRNFPKRACYTSSEYASKLIGAENLNLRCWAVCVYP